MFQSFNLVVNSYSIVKIDVKSSVVCALIPWSLTWFLKMARFLQIMSHTWHWKTKLCVWRCSTNWEFLWVRNPQSPQRKTLSAVWMLIWFLKFFLVKNFWLQCGHGSSLFCKCVRRWVANVPLWAKDSLHRSQMYFRSPVCVNVWRVRPHFRRNFMGQTVHWNGLQEIEDNLLETIGWDSVAVTTM